MVARKQSLEMHKSSSHVLLRQRKHDHSHNSHESFPITHEAVYHTATLVTIHILPAPEIIMRY